MTQQKKVKKVKVAQLYSTVCDSMDRIFHGILQVRLLEWVAFPFSRDLPNPGVDPRSPSLQADSLPAEPRGKPKNTGVGSLFLLQWIFLAQKSSWSILHCRRILYLLSYQGSPKKVPSNLVDSRKSGTLSGVTGRWRSLAESASTRQGFKPSLSHHHQMAPKCNHTSCIRI